MSLILNNKPAFSPLVIRLALYTIGGLPLSYYCYILVWPMIFFRMLLRTALLILAITAMGGAWLLEQPRSSIVLWHPRIRLLWRLLPQVARGVNQKVFWLLTFLSLLCQMYVVVFLNSVQKWLKKIKWFCVKSLGVLAKVFQASWWGGQYGAPTWKRHVGWSSSPTVQCLDLGRLCCKFKEKIAKFGICSTKKYFTKNGRKRFAGSKALKSTGPLGSKFNSKAWRFLFEDVWSKVAKTKLLMV